ncbi:MAG: outer membrane lipoprotein carrier protein LolA [Pricia sp.]
MLSTNFNFNPKAKGLSFRFFGSSIWLSTQVDWTENSKGSTKKAKQHFRNSSFFISSLVLLLFVLFSTNLFAQVEMTAAEANSLKAAVKNQADTVKTIISDFTQYKHLDFLSDDIESKGKLAFRAPDQVKWEYNEPFKYSLIFKEETLYINDAGNKSNMDLGGNKMFTQLNQLITASISGNLFDDDQFAISYFKDANNSLVKFTPKDAQFAEFIKAFHLTFNPAAEVIEVKMIEPSDDYTQIVFSDRKTNQSLSDADFAQ